MNMHALDRRVGLALGLASYVSIALVALGVAAMIGAGVRPLDAAYPGFDLGRLGSDVAAVRPEGLLWLGLLSVILTPVVRVVSSLIGFSAAGDRRQAGIAVAVLAIMALGVVVGHGG